MRYVVGIFVSCSLIEKVDRDAVESQQLVVFTVISTDHHERNLQRGGALFEQALRRFRDVDPMIARRVVMAWSLVVLARTAGRQVAVSGSANTISVTEDRQVTSVVRIFDRGGRVGVRQIQKDAYKARTRQLRHSVKTNL